MLYFNKTFRISAFSMRFYFKQMASCPSILDLGMLLVQETDCFLNPLIHLCFPFSYGFLPDKGIFIETGFQLRPINEYGFF